MDVNVSIILAIYTTCPASRVLEANRSDQAVIGPPPIQTPDQNRMTPPLLTLAGCIFPVPMKMQTDDVLMVFSAFYYDSENFGYENAIAILNVAGPRRGKEPSVAQFVVETLDRVFGTSDRAQD